MRFDFCKGEAMLYMQLDTHRVRVLLPTLALTRTVIENIGDTWTRTAARNPDSMGESLAIL